MAGGLSDLMKRNLGPIPWGISTKEVTQPTAMWAPAEKGSYSGHLVLTDEMVAEAGGTALQEEDQCSAATAAYQPFSQPEAQSRSRERRSQHDEALQEAREAHQWALDAIHRLELDIERLCQGVGNVQCQCPHSHSGSHQWSKSLDRWERSLSLHRLERHVTFHEPEVEWFSDEGPYQEPWGHLPQAQMGWGEEVLLPTRRMEIPCPKEMPTAYPDVKNRVGDPWEPSIKNYEVWLNWWASQLDTLHWWGELVAIPGVEDPRRLAQKIWVSFLIPVVRCEALLNQDYTMPPPPNASPGVSSFLMTLPIRTSSNNHCCWPWPMAKLYSIGQRRLICQHWILIGLWWWV